MTQTPFIAEMNYTGERMVPEQSDLDTFWEHIYRYRFATKFVRGKHVLDIACGEGYGTSGLSLSGATSVIGVDISEEACEHARQKYGIDARLGNAENIPLPDSTIDVIISFETVEHVANPEEFLRECSRVLTPGGVLVISTPNKSVYDQRIENPYHCSEMDEVEFVTLLRKHFVSWRIYTQQPASVAPWSPYCFASEKHGWNNWRGARRLKRQVRKLLCPFLNADLANSARHTPVQAILASAPYLSSIANPYEVRKSASWHQEKGMYLIGVALKEENA